MKNLVLFLFTYFNFVWLPLMLDDKILSFYCPLSGPFFLLKNCSAPPTSYSDGEGDSDVTAGGDFSVCMKVA